MHQGQLIHVNPYNLIEELHKRENREINHCLTNLILAYIPLSTVFSASIRFSSDVGIQEK